MKYDEVALRQTVGECLTAALSQIASGSSSFEWDKAQIQQLALKSISFPNNKSIECIGGKPHDIEIRVALALFHRWKRREDGVVEIVSDLGLCRTIKSPLEMAQTICKPLEPTIRQAGIAHDVRCMTSGIITVVTPLRSRILRDSGVLPCPFCTQWLKGEKGLWWHQQQTHSIEHSEAADTAVVTSDTLAVVPYDPDNSSSLFGYISKPSTKTDQIGTSDSDDPFEVIKAKNFENLKKLVKNGYDPSTSFDRKGATPLMWAAGAGDLGMVTYLVEDCGCLPSQTQRGKRSFSGRTALHWSARNGHLAVVKYLVEKCHVNVEDATIDGTTAFCWACWQGHLDIMKFLQERGANIHTINSFGCNPVLWGAQGEASVEVVEWMQSKGCDMTLVNHNGHGFLHKAGQRGQSDLVKWFVDHALSMTKKNPEILSNLIGPDTEGYCPSDLAGMEGHQELAVHLAQQEMAAFEHISKSDAKPKWLYDCEDLMSTRVSERELFLWEKYGGIRRMGSVLQAKQKDPSK